VPNTASAQTWLELRGSVEDTLLGRSERFHVRARQSFAFTSPTSDTIPVSGGRLVMNWESWGYTRNVWITLHDANTGEADASERVEVGN
ncbi:unnamed protein product, partial [Sphacelaria rigidula]